MNQICKGSYILGTACGECTRCSAEWKELEARGGYVREPCGPYTWHAHKLECIDAATYRDATTYKPPVNMTTLAIGAAFRVGDSVEKFTGDYQLPGIVRASFTTGKGHVRFVVEHEPGFLHIYSAANLRAMQPKEQADG